MYDFELLQEDIVILYSLHVMNIPMGTDQFLNQISTLIFGWEIVDFVTMINQ